MKKMFFAVFALAALSLLAPSAGFAEMGTAANQIGIYGDPGGDLASVNKEVAATFLPFNIYLVLTNPINHTYGNDTGTNVPVTMVSGFECRVITPAGLYNTGETLTDGALNVGLDDNYVVGMLATPVVNNAIVLATWEVNLVTLDPKEYFLDIATPTSVAGEMIYLDDNDPGTDQQQPMYASSGSVSAPVFSVNGGVVAIEESSWGGVKALFR